MEQVSWFVYRVSVTSGRVVYGAHSVVIAFLGPPCSPARCSPPSPSFFLLLPSRSLLLPVALLAMPCQYFLVYFQWCRSPRMSSQDPVSRLPGSTPTTCPLGPPLVAPPTTLLVACSVRAFVCIISLCPFIFWVLPIAVPPPPDQRDSQVFPRHNIIARPPLDNSHRRMGVRPGCPSPALANHRWRPRGVARCFLLIFPSVTSFCCYFFSFIAVVTRPPWWVATTAGPRPLANAHRLWRCTVPAAKSRFMCLVNRG